MVAAVAAVPVVLAAAAVAAEAWRLVLDSAAVEAVVAVAVAVELAVAVADLAAVAAADPTASLRSAIARAAGAVLNGKPAWSSTFANSALNARPYSFASASRTTVCLPQRHQPPTISSASRWRSHHDPENEDQSQEFPLESERHWYAEPRRVLTTSRAYLPRPCALATFPAC